MVPQDSRQPPPSRTLAPETSEALRVVIAERWRATEDADARLSAALVQAAHEAHERGLRPEELIIAMKTLEEEVMGRPGALRATDPDARRRFREWLVSACLKAYFER